MKNSLAVVALVLAVLSLILAIVIQVTAVIIDPWLATLFSAAAVAVGLVAAATAPRVLAVTAVIAGILLTFWNYVVMVGGL